MQDKEATFYLYKITNKVNNKVYIGVTKNPKLRHRQHMTKLSVKNLVAKAVKKYGKENFEFEVLCIGTKEYICSLEQKAIEVYNSNAVTGHGYNIASGGYGGSLPRRGKVSSRKDDKSVYVSGFWFPNKRTALLTLNWTNSKFRYRRDMGFLGETFIQTRVELPNRNTITSVPIYYKGFWFSGINKACEVYNMNSEAIKKDIRNRRFEQSDEIQNFNIARKYLVHGKPYTTLKDASQDLDIPITTLKGRYDRKKDTINYSYTYIKEDV
jgi:group I intron endonuclease